MEQYILMALLPIMGAMWRRKDGSNRSERWDISKGAWRALMAVVVIGFCFKAFGAWGIWTGISITVAFLMGFETITLSDKGWRSWNMWYRYYIFVLVGTVPLIYCGLVDINSNVNYFLATIFAGLCYPAGNYFNVKNYAVWCEYICGAIVIGGLAWI